METEVPVYETGKLIAHTDYSTGNNIEVPCRLVLRKHENGYVSRFQRRDNGTEFWGHYMHDTFENAKQAFIERVEANNYEYPKESPSHVGKITWVKDH